MGYKKKHYERGNRRRGRGRRARSTATTVIPVRPLEINEETRWKPHRSSRTTNESQSQKDARLVLLLLNKLTPHNFDKVVTAFLSRTTLSSDNERMRDAIHAIVERAALDMRYAQVHARLCARLATELEGFREALVNYCRHQDPSPQNEEDLLFEHPEEREARVTLERHVYVGTKRFIGELYNSGVLESTEVFSIVDRLLHQATTASDELALESLCALLDACGKTLDASPEMQCCWKALEEVIGEEGQLSFRMKCLVLDLFELRESGWCPKRYSSRQRKELIARPLDHRQVNGVRKSKGSKKKKTVHFA